MEKRNSCSLRRGEKDVGDVVGVEHEVRRILQNSHGRSHTKRDIRLPSRNHAPPNHHLDLVMVRQFKHHEKKLLKKVDFFNVRSFAWFSSYFFHTT